VCAGEEHVTIDRLITVRSSFGHGETLARFEAAVRANGLLLLRRRSCTRVEAGVSLDATTVLMVGTTTGRAGEGSSD
jgi:hypothetical protein